MKLTLKEIRDLGLLQEINRRVLHPAGFALQVCVDGDIDLALAATEFEVSVLDAREDPEGFMFEFGAAPKIDPAVAIAKAASVDALQEAHREERERLFGALIQPLPEPGA